MVLDHKTPTRTSRLITNIIRNITGWGGAGETLRKRIEALRRGRGDEGSRRGGGGWNGGVGGGREEKKQERKEEGRDERTEGRKESFTEGLCHT